MAQHGKIRVSTVFSKKTDGWHRIKIDRSTTLGNHDFDMKKDESKRDWACDGFHEQYHSGELGAAVRERVQMIYRMVRDGTNVELLCWCSPKRCHGETIKEDIERQLAELAE